MMNSSSESDDAEFLSPKSGGRPHKQIKTAEEESSDDDMSVESPQSVDPRKWKPADFIRAIFPPEWFVSDTDASDYLLWGVLQNLVEKGSSNTYQEYLTIDVNELVKNNRVVKFSREEIATNEVPPQDYGHEIPVAHDKDLAELSRKIENVKNWHGDRRIQQKYIAPLLPVIQSSGTGKSRLLKMYRNACRSSTVSGSKLCAVILCGSGRRQDQQEGIAKAGELGDENQYDDYYSTSSTNSPLGKDDTRRLYRFVEKVCEGLIDNSNQMNLEKNTASDRTDIVLMFDEAQHLTKQNPSGFLLRALRWITREIPSKRSGVLRNVNLTVVCSGTNSQLATFFPEIEITSSSTRMTEQDVDYQYINHSAENAKPYEPFFCFRTVGCLSKLPPKLDNATEFERSVPFGRPLFEAYRRKGELEKQMAKIVDKVVLGRKIDDITTSINVLGTRVQMGSSSFAVVSDLVGVGYAHLTSFRRPDEEARPSSVIADFAYLPDPVCARIAMMLMDKNCKLNRATQVANKARMADPHVEGKQPSWWSSRATDIFSKSICVMSKGDIGEVAVALYLLFCGDVLRRDVSENYTTFSVNLISWLNHLLACRGQANKIAPLEVSRGDASTSTFTINAIQFYREELRLTLNEYSSKDYLEYLYNCACGVYCHPNVQEFDLLKPIRFLHGDAYGYSPCFISVKNYEYLRPGLAKSFVKDSVRALLKHGVKAGLFLLVIVGQTEVKSKYSNLLGSSDNTDVSYMVEGSKADNDEKIIDESITECVSTNIKELSTKIVPKVLAIEPNDPFGINETAINGKPKLADISAVYTDHPMLLCMTKRSEMGQRISSTLRDPDKALFNDTLSAINEQTSELGLER